MSRWWNKEGEWYKGISWTAGHEETTVNPEKNGVRTTEKMWVHGGLFLNYYFWGMHFYFGMRPTAPSVSYTHLTLPTNREV